MKLKQWITRISKAFYTRLVSNCVFGIKTEYYICFYEVDLYLKVKKSFFKELKIGDEIGIIDIIQVGAGITGSTYDRKLPRWIINKNDVYKWILENKDTIYFREYLHKYYGYKDKFSSIKSFHIDSSSVMAEMSKHCC